MPRLRFGARWWGWAGLVVAGACLAQILRWELIGAIHLNLPGEGGYIGRWLGAEVLERIFGRIGSLAVLWVLTHPRA